MIGLGLFIDFQKAFDTVNHNILLSKIWKYGIRGKMHEWLSNYLKDRKQYTTINNMNSEVQEVQCGIPQGSALGPLLFLLYINDLPRAIEPNSPVIFADDCNLFLYRNIIEELKKEINTALGKIQDWSIAIN